MYQRLNRPNFPPTSVEPITSSNEQNELGDERYATTPAYSYKTTLLCAHPLMPIYDFFSSLHAPNVPQGDKLQRTVRIEKLIVYIIVRAADKVYCQPTYNPPYIDSTSCWQSTAAK